MEDRISLDAMDPLVVRDRLAARKMQTVGDGSIILLPFADVAVTGGEMGCQEAERGGAVVESDSDSALCWAGRGRSTGAKGRDRVKSNVLFPARPRTPVCNH